MEDHPILHPMKNPALVPVAQEPAADMQEYHIPDSDCKRESGNLAAVTGILNPVAVNLLSCQEV